ncbi:hypothetical protein ACFYW8_21720 [Streptomyces sp. NPDC002742]|jgi:hypothetical protein|uniref:hypothetical protein n=1 Tax=unclassified Streptomyces TaxID=2593676 RepID=UPI00343CF9C2
MRVKVRFRMDRTTGHIEVFEVVAASGQTVGEEDHDWDHEQIAHDLGSVLERVPDVREVTDPASEDVLVLHESEPEEQERHTERAPETEV